MGFGKVAAVVDGNTCTGQWIYHSVLDFSDSCKFVVIEKLGNVIDVDSSLELHVNFFEYFVDIIAEILVVFEFVVNFPD